MDWYVYHSERTMGRSYESFGEPFVLSTRRRPKLCLGDVIWVVEGFGRPLAGFRLADCFAVRATEESAIPSFTLKVRGDESLIRSAIGLDPASMPWFASLHSRFITKQRFFNSLGSEPEISGGLRKVSGVAI